MSAPASLGPWRARRAGPSPTPPAPEDYIADDGSWLDASVPETALSLLCRNGVLPDPNVDANLKTAIPDVFHVGRGFYTFWWCTTFEWPSLLRRHPRARSSCSLPLSSFLSRYWQGHREPQARTTQRRARLLLEGCNYSVRVFVNEVEVPVGPEGNKGMFLRRAVDVPTDLLKPTNRLAVLVEPPDHVGCVDKGGQGGDHMIAKDVTCQYVEGWDWIQPVPDRNTGLWGPVYLQETGPAVLSDPRAVVRFEGSAQGPADVAVTVGLQNLTGAALEATVTATAVPIGEGAARAASPQLSWKAKVRLGAGQSVDGFDLGHRRCESPALWWPVGYGEQALYELRVAVEAGGSKSHETSTTFGFRLLESVINPKTKSRQFAVNGVPIFVRGGNYIVPDLALRCAHRIGQEVRMHAEMGLNMIRLWGGAGVPYAEFFDACDRHGILVWSEFWITGDCDGRGATKDSPVSNPNWPLDHDLFVRCASDVVRKLRNHPSLVLWCGGNEQTPCESLDATLRAMVGEGGSLDDSRPYVSGSLWGGFGQGGGDWSDGPYGIQNEEDFFSSDFYAYGFNPECGSVGVPCAESIRTMFTTADLWEPPRLERNADGTATEIVSAAWNFHKYISYSTADGRSKILSYGPPPGSLDEFCFRAQIVNYTQYRALLEAWGSRMWTKYTGLLIWKTANPWTGLRGQLYDWYLNQTGGFYGAKACCAEMVHIQSNPAAQNALQVVNRLPVAVSGCVAEVETVCCPGNARNTQSWALGDLEPLQTTTVGHKIAAEAGDSVTFAKLRLRRGAETLSRNVYWLSGRGGGDFSALAQWGEAKVGISAKISPGTAASTFVARLENLAQTVAFFVGLKVAKGSAARTARDLLAPAFLSDNYVTLFPEEALDIMIDLSEAAAELGAAEGASLLVEGWNVSPFSVPLRPNNPLASEDEVA